MGNFLNPHQLSFLQQYNTHWARLWEECVFPFQDGNCKCISFNRYRIHRNGITSQSPSPLMNNARALCSPWGYYNIFLSHLCMTGTGGANKGERFSYTNISCLREGVWALAQSWKGSLWSQVYIKPGLSHHQTNWTSSIFKESTLKLKTQSSAGIK